MSFVSSVHEKAIDLTRAVVEMTTAAGSGHPSSASSLAHIAVVLLYDQMRYDPTDPDDPAADRLVLSEGHACPIVYAAAADLGFAVDDGGRRRRVEPADLAQLRQLGSPLEGHPSPRSGFRFFATATGSLGQGLSTAAGMAWAARSDGADARFYCIVGDGESREGQVWEALDFVVEQRLGAVCPVFNCNRRGQTGPVGEPQSADRLAQKLAAFGFEVRDVDGHDPAALRAAFAEHAARDRDMAPLAVVARTIKGWGSPRLQGEMHGKTLSQEGARAALADLDRERERLGAGGAGGELRRPEPPRARRPARSNGGARAVPSYRDALAELGYEKLRAQDRVATRQAHGIALQMLGRLRPDLVVLDGDVANSTMAEYFAADPASRERFLQCRIAEQHMLSCATGLAAAGKTAVVSTFGKFLVRGYDQLEMALIGGSNVKLVGSHVGITPSSDGPSQMALADVAFGRALASVARGDGQPSFWVLTPCDARSAYALTVRMVEHDGACYLRTQRPAVPHVYTDDRDFVLGGLHVLADGSDLALFAWGHLVHEALAAVRSLEREGVRATLVDAYCLPLDRERVAAIAAACGDRVLTVEDNYGAGLGSAVAEALAQAGRAVRFASMTVRALPRSAREPDELIAWLGLSADRIAERARSLLAP